MHPSLSMLDKAIEQAEREFDLLELEDVAGLEESATERLHLVEAAWAAREDGSRGQCDLEALGDKLRALHQLQNRLDDIARQRHEETREALKVRKQASRVISGYGNSARRSLLPKVITKNS